MRQAYKEGGELPTLWIVNEKEGIAIECSPSDDNFSPPTPNERCITHRLCDWGTGLVELKMYHQRTFIPAWFREVVHLYDGLCEV